MACDQMEAKIMKYHILSGMNAVNLIKVLEKDFATFKIKLSFLTDISHEHN